MLRNEWRSVSYEFKFLKGSLLIRNRHSDLKTEVSEINRANFPDPAIDRASMLYDL